MGGDATPSGPATGPDERGRRWLHRLAVASTMVTVALTCGLGGTITSTEVGMAYPTWPDINGSSLFNLFYFRLAEAFGWGSVVEHTHRQAGMLTGVLVMATAACALFLPGMPRRWKRLSVAALLLVIAQGLIGANRVLANSYPGAIAHALGAQAVVVVLVILVKTTGRAALVRPEPASAPRHRVDRLRLWSTVALALMFVNLFSAASLRHKQGAFAGHLLLAVTTTAVLLFLVQQAMTKFRDHAAMRRHGRQLALLLGAQLGLGVAAWAFLFTRMQWVFATDASRFLAQSTIATAHLLGGVLVMAAVAALGWEARHRLLPAGG